MSSTGSGSGSSRRQGGRALGWQEGQGRGTCLPPGDTGLATPLREGEGQLSRLLLDICPLPGRGRSLPRQATVPRGSQVKSLLGSHETSGEGAGEGNHRRRIPGTPWQPVLPQPRLLQRPDRQTAPGAARSSRRREVEGERLRFAMQVGSRNCSAISQGLFFHTSEPPAAWEQGTHEAPISTAREFPAFKAPTKHQEPPSLSPASISFLPRTWDGESEACCWLCPSQQLQSEGEPSPRHHPRAQRGHT